MNDHWAEWRGAVQRFGHVPALQKAAAFLINLDAMTPEQVEDLFRAQDQKGEHYAEQAEL